MRMRGEFFLKSGSHQQEAPKTLDPGEKQEMQQVCKSTPPLETVADDTTNRDAGNPSCRSFMVSERDDRGSRVERQRGRVKRERTREVSDRAHAEDLRREQRDMDLDQYDDSQSDSGVSVDFCPNSMSDTETPIEREIRLAFKREQSLRRSRGLDENKEFIEIPLRKSILSHDLPNKSAKDHGKERQFAGKKMQREISAEAERETVLVKLGRLPGFYDKGTVRQIQEKKLLFEAFQEFKDLQPSSDQTQEPANSMEMLFQNQYPLQLTETPPKALQISKKQDHETIRTVQEPKNKDTSCGSSGKILNGKNQDCLSNEHTRNTRLNSSPQLFPSLKEKKLLFESLQEKRDVQCSRDKNIEVSGSVKEQRKSLDLFFQNQNPALKPVQEPKDIEINRNQDEMMSGISKEPTRNLQIQSSKPCGPAFSEAVNRQVIIIENNPTVTPHTNGKLSHIDSTHKPLTERDSRGGRSSAQELQRNSRVRPPSSNGEVVQENPFFKLRTPVSLLPDVKKDIREARRREEELRKQRTSFYGNGSKVTTSPSRTTPTRGDAIAPGQNQGIPPGSSSFGKLDLTWPPLLQNGHKTQPEVMEQRQTNLLVQRWEAGLINGYAAEHHD